MALTTSYIPRYKGVVGGQNQVQDSAIADNGTNIVLARALSGTTVTASTFFATTNTSTALLSTTGTITNLIATTGSVNTLTASVKATIATCNATEVIATSTTSTSLSATSINIVGGNFTGITFAGSASGASAGITGFAIIPQIAATTGSITYVNGIVVAVVNPT